MFDENSFDAQAFSTDSWWISLVVGLVLTASQLRDAVFVFTAKSAEDICVWSRKW
jgi:hypothetical protein